MNYLLNIHTTSEKAIVNLSDGAKVLTTIINTDSRQHASFLHSAIHTILHENDISPTALKAIGVTGGPGSYTGIRVGLATAKGLCFALKIPMIMMNVLEVLAFSAIENTAQQNALYCPLIDARRMEVFAAIYDARLKALMPPVAMVLEENSFQDFIQNHPVYFFGSGSDKFKKIINNPVGYFFIESEVTTASLAKFTWNKFERNEFEDLIKSKVFYFKEFYSKKMS